MSNIAPIRLAIVDDEQLFLSGLQSILNESPALEVVRTANDGRSFLDALNSAKVLPDVVLLDMRMEPMNGIDTTHALREHYPELKVMMLSTYYRDAFLGYMIKLGVNAFLPKNLPPDTLVAAIKTVHEQGLYFTPEHVAGIQRQLMSGQKFAVPNLQGPVQLTKREREILLLIIDQYTSPEIAEKLFISIRTVEGHRNNLLAKTQARNTVGLVLYALLNNLVDVNERLVQYSIGQ